MDRRSTLTIRHLLSNSMRDSRPPISSGMSSLRSISIGCPLKTQHQNHRLSPAQQARHSRDNQNGTQCKLNHPEQLVPCVVFFFRTIDSIHAVERADERTDEHGVSDFLHLELLRMSCANHQQDTP